MWEKPVARKTEKGNLVITIFVINQAENCVWYISRVFLPNNVYTRNKIATPPKATSVPTTDCQVTFSLKKK